MNDQTQKITDRTDQTCCSREFFLSKSGCQFSSQRRTDYKHRNVAQKRNCRLCSRTSVIVRKYISCHPLHSKHCKEQKQCCHNNSNQRPVCNQILSQCRQIKFLIICRNRNTLPDQFETKHITDDCTYRKNPCNNRHTASGKYWIAIYSHISNKRGSRSNHQTCQRGSNVESDALSFGSAEIAEAIEPYGILIAV